MISLEDNLMNLIPTPARCTTTATSRSSTNVTKYLNKKEG